MLMREQSLRRKKGIICQDSRGLSVGSFNFGIGSIGSKHMDVAPTKIFLMDGSYIPLAKKVGLTAACSLANQFATVACSLVLFWQVAKGYYEKRGKKGNYMKIMCPLISFQSVSKGYYGKRGKERNYMEIIGTDLRELTWNQTLASLFMVQESWCFNRITFACHFLVLLLLLFNNRSSLYLHGTAK